MTRVPDNEAFDGEGLRDRFNGPRPAAPDPSQNVAPATPEQVAQAQQLAGQLREQMAVPVPVNAPVVDYNLMGRVFADVLVQHSDIERTRRAEEKIEEQRLERLAKKQEEEARVSIQKLAVTTPPRERGLESNVKSNEEVQAEWDKQQERATFSQPRTAAEKFHGPLDKEAVAIVTSVITVIATVMPWLGVTLTGDEINQFTTGILALLSSLTIVAGVVGGIIMRMKVSSKATVDKARGKP